MAGGADDRLGAEQCPGRGQRAVGLAQMYADAQSRGQFGIVVDDQLSLVARAQFIELFGFTQAPCLVAAFVAVLQQGDATVQRRLDVGEEFAGQQLAVGNGVKAA